MNIVPLHDYWRDPNGAYLVMRYLRGQGKLEIEDIEGETLESLAKLFELSVAQVQIVVRWDV